MYDLLPPFPDPVDLLDPVAAHPLNAGRLAWWLVVPGADGGPRWYDLMGGPAGVLAGAAAWDRGHAPRPGGWGRLAFAASGARVEVPDSARWMPATNRFTVASWCRRDDTVGDYSNCLFSNAGTSSPYATFEARGGNAANSLEFAAGISGLEYKLQSGSVLPLGQPVHFVLTYDGSTLALYRDGVLDQATAASGALYDPGQPLWLGDNPAFSPRPWPGGIDDFAIWDRALAAPEVRAQYDEARAGYPGTLRRVAPMAAALPAASAAASGYKTWYAGPAAGALLGHGAI